MQEIELKFLVPEYKVDSLMRQAKIKSSNTTQLAAHYYDTVDNNMAGYTEQAAKRETSHPLCYRGRSRSSIATNSAVPCCSRIVSIHCGFLPI